MKTKLLEMAGLAVLLVLVTVSVAFAAHTIVSTVTYDDGTTIAVYQVVNDPSTPPDISHVKIPACIPGLVTVQGCPGPVEQFPDGIKCEAGGSYTLTLIFGDELEVNPGQAIIKAGTQNIAVPVDEVVCIPQAVTIERFEIVNGAFEWDATQDGLGYWIEYHGKSEQQITAWVPAQSPGNWGFFSYRVWPWTKTLPYGTYVLMAQDVNGAVGVASTYEHTGKSEWLSADPMK